MEYSDRYFEDESEEVIGDLYWSEADEAECARLNALMYDGVDSMRMNPELYQGADEDMDGDWPEETLEPWEVFDMGQQNWIENVMEHDR